MDNIRTAFMNYAFFSFSVLSYASLKIFSFLPEIGKLVFNKDLFVLFFHIISNNGY